MIYGLKVTANGKLWADSEIGKIVIYGHGVKLFERDTLDAYEMRKNAEGIETLSEVYRGIARCHHAFRGY